MLIFHKGHTDTIQIYSVTVMTHVKALQAGHSSQGTPEPITTGLHVSHPNVATEFQNGHFFVKKPLNAFSSLPIDHVHEQNNKSVKGDRGAIGLKENMSEFLSMDGFRS